MAATPTDTRKDARKSHQIRAISLEEGFLSKADGSARLTQGNTMVMCGVFGPAASRTVKPGQRSEFLEVDVVLGPQSGVPAEKLASYKQFILDVLLATIRLDQYPHCAIEVTLRCLRDDGSLLAALINVAMAAIMDAGVDMMMFPVASNFLWRGDSANLSNASSLVADPDVAEEQGTNVALITIVCTAEMNPPNILAIDASGIMEEITVPQCCDAAVSVAKSFAEISRQKLGC
jgi:ribonuclease PH